MAMGGVPKYLALTESGKSATQIINEQFFTVTGYLGDEFNKLYSSLFSNYDNHIKIVKLLAKSNYGLTRNELLSKAKIISGGTASKILRELEDSGFIIHVPYYSKNESLARYKLIDQYSLFYLKWVAATNKWSTLNNLQNYWIEQANTQAWHIWCGYAFENICLLHVNKIQQALGLSGIRVSAYIWYSKDNKQPGAQIDLLLDRADNCINLCEIKYYNQPFEITKKYGEELDRKKTIFAEQTKCSKSLFTTLITTYKIVNNVNFSKYIQNKITIDAFFLV